MSQINASNVRTLSVAWKYKVNTGSGGGLFGNSIKATPLEVNGVLYFTVPDHAWAVDARTGQEIWHYNWETKGGIHIGNRGVGIYGNWLFFETPDNYLVSLDKNTGKLRWSVEIADVKQEYFSTPAPLIIGNHVLVGVGGDSLDVPGYLESRDPETGEVQWRWNSEPKPGEPGSETWPNKEAMAHGGGMTWMPGTYDPELNLHLLGHRQSEPGACRPGPQRRQSVDLFHRRVEPGHRQDGVVVPGRRRTTRTIGMPCRRRSCSMREFEGQPRKLLAQASRNGYFFLLDRTNGKNLVTAPFM